MGFFDDKGVNLQVSRPLKTVSLISSPAMPVFQRFMTSILPGPALRALGAVLLLALGFPVLAATPVTLQLKWTHNFQFAGYYAALEKGYYRDAGLEVRIEEARPGLDVVGQVVSGRADFGVGNSALLLDRHAGRPVVVLATIFQHSPAVYIARRQSAAQSVHDLAGQRVMVEPAMAELTAYLRREGIADDRLTVVEHSFNTRDLIDGKVDAMSAYLSHEPYFLDQAGVDYQIFTPRSVGIDFYGDNLFTSESLLKARPDLARAFRRASLRGWEYAMAHPGEIATLIHERYAPAVSRDFQLFAARQMQSLIRADMVEIGYMNKGRWQHIAETYEGIGMLPANFDFAGFLYAPDGSADLEGLRAYLGLTLALTALVSAGALYVYRMNRRLKRSVAEAGRAAAELQAGEEKYRLLTETMLDVVWTADAETLRFCYVSPSVERLLGYTPAELIGTPLLGALDPAIADEVKTVIRKGVDTFLSLSPGTPVFRTDEFRLPCKHGDGVWVEVLSTCCRNPASGVLELHGVARDISERRASQARIAHMAQHDMLTELPNRAVVSDRLSQALAAARRNGHRVGLLYIDLDRFKPVNDAYGHAVGDQLLRQAAIRMRGCVRESDTVARFGGDEFVVLLPLIDTLADAATVAEKIRAALAAPFHLASLRVEVSSSIGVALYPDHGADEAALTLHADAAMYAAKHCGRDRVTVFSLAA